MKKICFTGHRDVRDTEKVQKTLLNILKSLINDGAEDFYAGGATGLSLNNKLCKCQ